MNDNKFVLPSTSLLISQEMFLLYVYLRAVYVLLRATWKDLFKVSLKFAFDPLCFSFMDWKQEMF